MEFTSFGRQVTVISAWNWFEQIPINVVFSRACALPLSSWLRKIHRICTDGDSGDSEIVNYNCKYTQRAVSTTGIGFVQIFERRTESVSWRREVARRSRGKRMMKFKRDTLSRTLYLLLVCLTQISVAFIDSNWVMEWLNRRTKSSIHNLQSMTHA